MAIVIPAYNEEHSLRVDEFHRFLRDTEDCFICFVNDGSTDETQHMLNQIIDGHPEQTMLLNLQKNRGKATAVRSGVLQCLQDIESDFIAYLDADLAVSLEECFGFAELFNPGLNFCFGSRILKVGSNIQRVWYRFLIGRGIATIISNMLPIRVYDTQCGCKVFRKDICSTLFSESFISNWLFDVEIFYRYIQHFGVSHAIDSMQEVPLKAWIDRGDSKVKMTYFFKLWLDIFRIYKKYGWTGSEVSHACAIG